MHWSPLPSRMLTILQQLEDAAQEAISVTVVETVSADHDQDGESAVSDLTPGDATAQLESTDALKSLHGEQFASFELSQVNYSTATSTITE